MTQATNTHTPPLRPLTSGKTAVALLDTVAGLRKGAACAQIQSRRMMLAGSGAMLAGVTAFLTVASVADSPDAELIALCAEFDTLERAAVIAFDDAADDGLFDEATASGRPFLDKQRKLLKRMVSLRAQTPAGFEARANTILLWLGSFESELLEEYTDPENHGNWHHIMLATFMRDAIGHDLVPVVRERGGDRS